MHFDAFKILASLVLSAGALATPAAAESFFSEYNLGVTYDLTDSNAQLHYSAPLMPTVPDDCNRDMRAQELKCTAYLAPADDATPTPGVFLEKPFKRTGFFYFDFGPTFSTVAYKGGIVSKPKTVPSVGKKVKPAAPPQPLDKAYMELYGINWQGFVSLGITPHYIPDVILSVGAGVQTAVGKIHIFAEENTKLVVQPDAFAEIEVVLIRFHSGYLSGYYGSDQSLADIGSDNFVEDHPSGSSLTNFDLQLITAASGIRLLFPF